MGSASDWEVMRHAVEQLENLGIPYEAKVVSVHRTPDLLFEYAEQAEARGLACIIAGAGGAAHLPGMLAAKTTVPVLGVPVPSKYLKGMDSLLSIVQMPIAEEPVGRMGKPEEIAAAVVWLSSLLGTPWSSTAAKRCSKRSSSAASPPPNQALHLTGAAVMFRR